MDAAGYGERRLLFAVQVFADTGGGYADFSRQFFLGEAQLKHPFPYDGSKVRIADGEMFIGVVCDQIGQDFQFDTGRVAGRGVLTDKRQQFFNAGDSPVVLFTLFRVEGKRIVGRQ